MLSSKDILYSKGNNDECYTPAYAVKPILDFVPRSAIIWCPFDTEESEFVKHIVKTNIVIYSHISTGRNFFTYEPPEWDVIVSNPPFTGKREIFERALSFGKPFALLMSNTWLNDKYSKWVFYEANRQMQLLMFDKRIKYTGDNRITFSSSYFCCDLLPRDIILRKLEAGRINESRTYAWS